MKKPIKDKANSIKYSLQPTFYIKQKHAEG